MGNEQKPEDRMTRQDFVALERLTRKAKWDESLKLDENSKDMLSGVNLWASRMS